MGYKLSAKTEEFQQSVVVKADGFGDWKVQNTGTGVITVDGYPVPEGETVPYIGLQPNVVWNTPITIIVPAGGKMRMTRFYYQEMDNASFNAFKNSI